MKIRAAIVMLTFLGPASAIAAGASPPARENCGAEPDQAEMNACFGRDLQRADARLNGAYVKRLDGLKDDPEGVRLLRAAERAWMDFRDRNCAFQAHGEEGGSIYPTMVATCRITMTEARTKEIAAPD